MLNSPELNSKNSEVLTNEISVQVESHDLQLYSRHKSQASRFFSNKKFEFFSQKEPEELNQKLLSKSKSKLNRISALSNRIPSSFSYKPDNHDLKCNMSPYLSGGKEIKLKNIRFEKLTPGKTNKRNKPLSEIPLKDPLFSNAKITKCPSAYQIPPVFNPMDNFVTTNVPAKLSRYKFKAKAFKPIHISSKRKLNLKRKSFSTPGLSVEKNAKIRVHFKQIPKVLSFNIN